MVVIPLFGDEPQATSPAPVEVTGQETCYDQDGTAIGCSGTGQDGEYQKGVAWPDPRFTDNTDGTVTDNLTGLIWLKNANCSSFFSGDSTAQNGRNWKNAVTAANSLADGYCGLSDGSSANDWRLPNTRELQSLIDFSNYSPALPSGHPFTGVQTSSYWSSTTIVLNTDYAWYVYMYFGGMSNHAKDNVSYVWPVRGGN